MRYQQPQAGPLKLDPSNPLTKNIAWLWHAPTPDRDLVGGGSYSLLSSTDLLFSVGKFGKEGAGGSGRGRRFTLPDVGTVYTIVAVVRDSVQGSTRNTFDADTGTGSNRVFQLGFNSSNVAVAIPFAGGGAPYFPVGSGAVSSTGLTVFGLTVDANQIATVWTNGTPGSGVAMSGPKAVTPADTICVGNLNDAGSPSAQPFLGESYLGFIVRGAWGAAEWNAFTANPWQIFQDEDPIYPQATGNLTLTGVVGTWAPGSVGVQVDATRALTGVVGTWAAGNVTAQAASTLALSGVQGTWAPGTLTPVVDAIRALTGVQGTWSAGTVTPSAVSGLTLTSVTGTWAVGSVAVQVDATRALAGVAGTWGVGTVSPSSASSLALAGNQGTWAVGSVAATAAATAALTGVQGNWQAGSLEVGGDKQAALTGVVGTWGVGTVTVEPPRPVNFGGWIDYPKKKPTKKETQPKEKAVEKENLRELIVQAIAAKAAPVAPRAVLAALPARVPKVQQRLKAEVDAVIETLVDDDDEEDLLLLIL